MPNNKNEYTSDLFGVVDCTTCKGTGEIALDHVEVIEDCEDCNGTGVNNAQ